MPTERTITTKREFVLTFAAGFTTEQEQTILDLASEYIKQIKAICDNVEFNFSLYTLKT
jgi:hypothetical protein